MKIVIFAHGKIKKGPELELISGYVARFNKQFNSDFFTSLEISESAQTEKLFNDKVAKMLDLEQSTVLLDRNGEHHNSESFADFLTSLSENPFTISIQIPNL